jgi:hypothetical protein
MKLNTVFPTRSSSADTVVIPDFLCPNGIYIAGEVKMNPAARDLNELLSGIPIGAWVAISQDETRVVAFAEEMRDVIEKAHAAGEENPIITRVPQPSMALVL